MNVPKCLLRQLVGGRTWTAIRYKSVTNYGCYKNSNFRNARSPKIDIHELFMAEDHLGENGGGSLESSSELPHIPVLLSEVLFYLDPKPGQTIVDMTFGSGGHSRKLLETVPDLRIFALDRDPVGYDHAQKLAEEFPGKVIPLLGRFSEIKSLLSQHGVSNVDGVLFDFGCSSMQFDDPTRGFGVSHPDAPLDMRMDGHRFPNAPTAAQVLKYIEEDDLARIIKVYGEELKAKQIARAVVEARYLFQPLETTSQFAALVAAAINKNTVVDKLSRPAHSATKTFQALRIFVNNELNEINRGLELAYQILNVNGTIVALTFHSLEDRIVKRHLIGIEMDEPVAKTLNQKYLNSLNTPTLSDVESVFNNQWSVVTKHVVIPTLYEVKTNPRARSAKLRCATKN